MDSDARLEVPESSYKELSDFKIFTVVDEMIRIAFLDEQLSELTDLSETKRKAAHARWSKCNASAMQVHDSAMPKEKKRGDKKRKEEKRGKSSVPTESEVRAYAQDNGYNPTFMWEKMRGYIDNDMEDSYGNPIKNWKLKLNQVWFKPEHKISNSHTQLVR